MALTPDWIVGFVDRAASFFVIIEVKKSYQLGRRFRPEFRIVQSSSERKLLEELQKYFRMGKIRKNSSGQYEYRIRDHAELELLMEFFGKYPLQSAKQSEAIRFGDLVHELVLHPVMDAAAMRRLEKMAKPLMKSHKRRSRLAS